MPYFDVTIKHEEIWNDLRVPVHHSKYNNIIMQAENKDTIKKKLHFSEDFKETSPGLLEKDNIISIKEIPEDKVIDTLIERKKIMIKKEKEIEFSKKIIKHLEGELEKLEKLKKSNNIKEALKIPQ